MSLFFAAALTLSLTSCANDTPKSHGRLSVPSWDELSKQLRDAVPKALEGGKAPHDYVFDVPAACQIRDDGTIELWLDMCSQGDKPMVAITGFMCISEKSPEHKFKAALTVMTNRPEKASLYFYVPPLRFLSKELKPSAVTFSVFDEFAADIRHDRKGLPFALSSMPDDFVTKWALSRKINDAIPYIQAYALDYVYVDAKSRGIAVPDHIAKLLESFANTDGARRATFVRHASDTTDQLILRNAIIAVIKDDDLDNGSYLFALMDRLGFIRDHLDLDTLGLSEAQTERFAKLKSAVESRE